MPVTAVVRPPLKGPKRRQENEESRPGSITSAWDADKATTAASTLAGAMHRRRYRAIEGE
jgi:hypothetical protein